MSKTAKSIFETVQENGYVTISVKNRWYGLGRIKPDEESAGVVRLGNISTTKLMKELKDAGLELHPFPKMKEHYLVS